MTGCNSPQVLCTILTRVWKVIQLHVGLRKGQDTGGRSGGIPFISYTGMCCCEGYGFQAVQSGIGYRYHAVKTTGSFGVQSRIRLQNQADHGLGNRVRGSPSKQQTPTLNLQSIKMLVNKLVNMKSPHSMVTKIYTKKLSSVHIKSTG